MLMCAGCAGNPMARPIHVVRGCLLLLGFQKIPYSMVYFVVAFKILVPFVLGCVVYSVAGACIDEACLDDDDAGCTGKTQQVCGSPTPAYVFFAISAIVALVAWWYRDVLRLVAKLFQVSSVALTKNWQLLPFGALLAVSKLVVLTGMWSLLLLGVLTMDIKPQPNANAMIEAGEFGCYPDVQSHVSTYISFATFTMGWFSFWALETRNYIVADTIGAWYWHGTKGASVIRATKHAFCSHFGSMALAGAVMWFCEYLKKKAKCKDRSQHSEPASPTHSALASAPASFIFNRAPPRAARPLRLTHPCLHAAALAPTQTRASTPRSAC